MTLGLSFTPIPMGLLFAQFISNMTFQIEDSYFTRESAAQDKISWLNFALACCTAIVIVATSINMPEVSHQGRCSFVRFWLRTRGFWANGVSVMGPVVSFFLLVPQWSYICNQFAFTFDQAAGFMLFFATGACWAGLGADMTLGKLHLTDYRSAIWVPTGIYTVCIAILLVTIEALPNVWLTRIICFLIGASLFTSLIGSLQTSISWLDAHHPTNDQSFRVTFGVMLMSFAMILSTFFSWLADRMYYSNRNV